MNKKHFQAAVIGCVHCPFQCDRAVDVALKVLAQEQPELIILNGDILDCYTISRFPKAKNRGTQFQYEITKTKEFIKKIQKTCPGAKIVFCEGNHELRIQTYLSTHAKELASLTCLELTELLELDDFGIEFVRYGDYFNITPTFVVTHGTVIRQKSGASAMGEQMKSGLSGVSNHTHRLGTVNVTNRSGQYSWTEAGCLCLPEQEYVLGTADWQQGMAIVSVYGEEAHTETVSIQNGVGYFRGCRIKS